MTKVAQLIQAQHPPHVAITGYTDSIGTDEYNVLLSLRRARSVEAWLTGTGPGAGHRPYGRRPRRRRDPVAPNTLPDGADNPAGRQQNRRVDILLSNS